MKGKETNEVRKSKRSMRGKKSVKIKEGNEVRKWKKHERRRCVKEAREVKN